MNESQIPQSNSPRWTSTTKLVVGLTLTGILLALIVTVRSIIAPLLIAIMLAYLIYPIAFNLHRWLHGSWRLLVTLIYLLILAALVGLLTWGGIALVEQVQSLLRFIENTFNNIPSYIAQLNAHPLQIGPFQFGGNMDWLSLWTQLSGILQPTLNKAGSLVGSVASGAASIIGWIAFTLLVSYFALAEAAGDSSRIINIRLPGYAADLKRMQHELGTVWNAFLRGQLVIISLTVIIYIGLLGILGVKFYFGLALMAGMARFIPYIGPFIAWTTYGLVAYFQGSTIFGLNSLVYAFLIVGIALLVDNIIDNFISLRLMSNVLQIHPAAVTVTAIIGATLLGFIGIILAAPVVATVKLFMDYTVRKLLDLDPWEGLNEATRTRKVFSIRETIKSLWARLKLLFPAKK